MQHLPPSAPPARWTELPRPLISMASAVPRWIETIHKLWSRCLLQSTSTITLSRYPQWSILSIAISWVQLMHYRNAVLRQPTAVLQTSSQRQSAVQVPKTTSAQLPGPWLRVTISRWWLLHGHCINRQHLCRSLFKSFHHWIRLWRSCWSSVYWDP